MQLQLNQDNDSVNNFLFWLYIYFVIDFFMHLSERIPGYSLIRPTLILVIIISFMLLAQKDRFTTVLSDPVFKSVKVLLIYLVISLPLVTWPGSVLINNTADFVKSVVFFFFTALIIDTEKRLKIFLVVFVVCQAFRALEPLYLHFTIDYWGSATYLGGGEFALRLSGAPADVINPNGLGFVIVTVIPFLYYLGWQSPSKILKLLSMCTMPLLVYALVLTMSRGSFLALLVVMWMIFKDSKHKLFFIILSIVGMVAIWVNLSDAHKDRYLSLVSSSARQSSTAQGRWQGMVDEFGVALERPLVGHGLGTSAEAKTHAGVGWLVSHNLYIEILIEIGSIGFIIFFVYIKSIYARFRENIVKLKQYYHVDGLAYIWRLNTALKAVFWMYIVFSVNYFGLSSYYWYMFGGMSIAFSRVYFSKDKINSLVPANA